MSTCIALSDFELSPMQFDAYLYHPEILIIRSFLSLLVHFFCFPSQPIAACAGILRGEGLKAQMGVLVAGVRIRLL